MPADSGSPRTDASYDFSRARRRQALRRLLEVLRRDGGGALSYDDVIAAAGFEGERRLGLQVVKLDTIAGSVDRTRDFDRAFLPTSGRTRQRWERVAAAYRSGSEMPPIVLRRIGDLHFVVDGHHRVSAARSLGLETLDAIVTEVRTRVPLDGFHDLTLKKHERLFSERVPLSAEQHARIELPEEAQYGMLAEGVEAWGFRVMQDEGELLDRGTVARRWFTEVYEPAVALIHEAGMLGGDTEAAAFLRVEAERYLSR